MENAMSTIAFHRSVTCLCVKWFLCVNLSCFQLLELKQQQTAGLFYSVCYKICFIYKGKELLGFKLKSSDYKIFRKYLIDRLNRSKITFRLVLEKDTEQSEPFMNKF